jgi:hypothetical protein
MHSLLALRLSTGLRRAEHLPAFRGAGRCKPFPPARQRQSGASEGICIIGYSLEKEMQALLEKIAGEQL